MKTKEPASNKEKKQKGYNHTLNNFCPDNLVEEEKTITTANPINPIVRFDKSYSGKTRGKRTSSPTLLHKADFMNPKLVNVNFGQLNLSGQELPDLLMERFSFTINLISDVAKNLQKICFILITVSVYIAFTLNHIEDQHLFIKDTQIELPIFHLKMPGLFFLIPAQLLILFIFLFFQIYKKHVISLIDDLPMVFPDGVDRCGKLHPWILLMGLEKTKPRKFNPITSTKWTAIVPGILSWGLLPVISLLVLIRTLKSQNKLLTFSVCGIFLLTCLVTCISNHWVRSMRHIKMTLLCLFFIFVITIFFTFVGVRGNFLPFDLENAALEEMDLIKFNFQNAKLNNANLKESNLCQVNLNKASLDRIKAENAKFSFAHLNGAYLNYAKLMGAKFISSQFIGAHLIGANFSDANLSNADLSGAILIFCNFAGADLKDTKFDGANLISANFKGAKNFTIEQLLSAKIITNVQLDTELEEQFIDFYYTFSLFFFPIIST